MQRTQIELIHGNLSDRSMIQDHASTTDDRELTPVEERILLDDLANLNTFLTQGWDKAQRMIQNSIYLVVSLTITIEATGHFLPQYLPQVIPALIAGLTISYFFFELKVDSLIWADYWREVLERRLGAWKTPGIKWRTESEKLPTLQSLILAKFYAWPFREWWLYTHQFLAFTFMSLMFFGGMIFFLILFLFNFAFGLSFLVSILIGFILTLLWTIAIRSAIAIQIDLFDSKIKEILAARWEKASRNQQ